MTNNKLLNCPWCGGSAKHYHEEPSISNSKHLFYVACIRCGACGLTRHNSDAAAEEWNKRDMPDYEQTIASLKYQLGLSNARERKFIELRTCTL